MESPEIPPPEESQLNAAMLHLLQAASDREAFVRESACKALQNLANKYQNEVVDAVYSFRKAHPKLPEHHLVALLVVLECVARDNKNLRKDVVEKLVHYSVQELLVKDNSQTSLKIASDILVFLVPKHCNQVLSNLIPLLEPNTSLNPSILSTLGHLAMCNANECIRVIKSALSVIVPAMPTCRNEQMRIATSFVVGKFCEAITEYTEFSEDTKDDTITKETFAEEIVSAYNVIANSWIQAKETKVVESSINALGPIFNLLPEDKKAQATSRAVICLLNAYKRPLIPHHSITQCLAVILRAAPETAVKPVLDQILFNLGNMVVVPPDYNLPNTVKQNNELLRCYNYIGQHFSDHLADLIVSRLRMGNQMDKVEVLLICAHLISGPENILSPRMNEITSAIRSTLQNPSMKVKKTLVKTIVALCCKGYASDGSDFIEFLVRHCAVQPTQTEPDHYDLASMCSSTIHLLSSTVDEMSRLMWTTLLKILTDPAYDHAVSIVTEALANIAPKEDPANTDGEPSRELVLCRCFALLGSPLNGNRGPSVLRFLQQYSRFVNVHINELWSHKLPQLINYLQESEWNDSEWESLLLEVINNTVTTISCHDIQWPVQMASNLNVMLNGSSGEEASVILSTLAIATTVIEDKQLVFGHVDLILSKFKTTQLSVKECARAVGILATAHLDLVLSRLDAIAQTELNRRNSRLLGLMKDAKAEAEIEKCREALLECYAALCSRCPLKELLPKLDELTQWIMNQITLAKDPTCKNAALEALLNSAESLIRHNSENRHTIKCRVNALDVLLQLIQNSKPEPLPLRVVTILVKLPPILVPEARQHILKTCFDKVLSHDVPINSSSHDSVVATQTLKQLGELVEELLMSSVTPDRLDEITSLLGPWMRHKSARQRLRAVMVMRTTLLAYYHNMEPGVQSPTTFNQCGDLVGSLVIRYFDSDENVGRIASHCIGILLAIAHVYDGHSHEPSVEKILENIPDENPSYHVSKILCGRLPHAQLHKLTGRLLDGLTDFDQTACSNAATVLACVFSLKGAELFHSVNDILGSLLLQLVSSGNNSTNGVPAVIALAKHHPKLVISILLKQPLPLHASLSDCWKGIANEPSLSAFALDHILQILSSSNLFDEDVKVQNRPKIASFLPLAAVSGLSEMVLGQKIEGLLREHFVSLLSNLLTLLAAYIGAAPPVLASSPSKSVVITSRDAFKIVPAREVKDCLQRILTATGCTAGAEVFASLTQLQHIDSLVTCIPQFTCCICQSYPHLLAKLLLSLNRFSDTPHNSQRTIITAFYAECLAVQCSSNGSVDLIDSLVSCLLSAWTAPDHTVRATALRGLSYISNLSRDHLKRHEESVLACLIEGLDDAEGSVHTKIPLEAMLSLSKLVPALDEDSLEKIQIPIAVRVKPFFEKEEIALRCTSLRLLGQLCLPNRPASKQSAYRDQVLSCFTCLLLHLTEPETSVVKACKATMREISSILGADKVSELIQKHLLYNGVLQFQPFVTTLVQHLVEEMKDLTVTMFNNSLTYTKSNWLTIRGNAAVLLATVYSQMDAEMRQQVSIEPAIARLLQMTKDPSSEVRAKSVRALPLLFLQEEVE